MLREEVIKMRIDWQRLSSVGICITLGALFLFLLGKYLIAVLLPFFIAWIMAFFTNCLSTTVSQRLRLPKKLCSAAILLLLFLIIGLLLYLGVTRFFSEIEKFLGNLTKDSALSQSLSEFGERLSQIGDHIPLVNHLVVRDDGQKIGSRLDDMITSFLKGFASDLGTAITSFATGVIRTLPSIVLFIVISIIASFYFALDFEMISERLVRAMPMSIQKKLPKIKAHTRSLAARYLKAYAILMALTFFELIVGLTLIGADYAFLLATLISLLDILPVLGVGTVLIPWAVLCFFTYDFGRGIALVALWGVVTVVRQISEPRIVGGTIGLHPALTLIGMYVGFKLFNIWGMLLAPAAIIAIKSYLGNRYIQNSAIDTKSKR